VKAMYEMLTQSLQHLESTMFKMLNSVAEPLIRAGFGNPVCTPAGPIVLEITGRKTRRRYKVPVLAARFGGFLLVGTVRRRSQWLKNLAASSDARYWLAGKLHKAKAIVIGPDFEEPSLEELPFHISYLARTLAPQSQLLGIGFAILVPREAKTKVH